MKRIANRKFESEWALGALFFKEETGQWAFKLNDTEGYVVATKVPEWLSGKNRPQKQSVKFEIRDTTEINRISPLAQTVDAIFKGFSAKEGELPEPVSGQFYDQDVLWVYAIFEILTEGWKGATFSVRLEYSRLHHDKENGKSYIFGRSRGAVLLESFMDAIGWENDAPAWSSNMLPDIERGAKKSRIIKVTFNKDGWVEDFTFDQNFGGHVGDEEESEEIEIDPENQIPW